jgi:hypothetical protein
MRDSSATNVTFAIVDAMGWPHAVDVSANVGYLSAYTAALGCQTASFEPSKKPRCYLEASAALQDLHHHRWMIYHLAIGMEVSSSRNKQAYNNA